MRRRRGARFRVLRRVLRARALAKQFDLPLCDRDRLKAMTDGCYMRLRWNCITGARPREPSWNTIG
jgi:hypothetical protein